MIDLDLWPDVAPLLDEALDLDGDDRTAFLDGVENDAVRGELRRYLDYAATDGEGTLADLFAPRPLTGIADGAQVGPYRVGPLLGSGGAGAVYRALDVRAQKPVALKVLAAPEDPDRAGRLEREVRALGRLEHPNVARYLGAGEADVEIGASDGDAVEGVLWIAMELVDGEHVTAFADREDLGETERVGLLIQACAAVQHALGRAVLHRDLKPSNVMAYRDETGRAVVKVLDFGVGRLLDEDGDAPTPPASFRLTPAYAAPEQLRGEPATAATDVWGLGVIGRELLRGTRESEDLDAVLSKARADDPDDRYDDAGALHEDLRRALDGHPVRARVRTPLYVARSFVRRHWLGVTGATVLVVLALLAVGAVVRARVLADTESARASQVAALLRAAFEEADPLTGGDLDVSRDLVERVERAAQSSGSRPDVDWEVKALLGSAYLSAGDLDRALALEREALESAESAFGPEDARVADVLRRLGLVYTEQSRYGAADSSFARALAVLSSSPDADTERETLEAQAKYLLDVGRAEEAKRVFRAAHRLCVRDRPSDPVCLRPLNGVARVLSLGGDSLRVAERILTRVHAAYRSSYGDDDLRTAAALSNLAQSLDRLGESERAIAYQRRALATAERLLGTDHPTRMTALNGLAVMLGRVGETDPEARGEAVALLTEHVDYQRRRDPNTLAFAFALNNLAAAIGGGDGGWARKVPYLEEALVVMDRVGVAPSLPLLQTTHNNLAVALMRLERYDEAESHFRRSRGLLLRRVDESHPAFAQHLLTYSQQLSYRGDTEGAEATIDRAIDVFRATLGPDHPQYGMALVGKSILLTRWGRQEEARPLAQEGLRIRRAAAGGGQ